MISIARTPIAYGFGRPAPPIQGGGGYLADAGVKVFGLSNSIGDRCHDPQALWTSTGERSVNGKGALSAVHQKDPRFKFYAHFDAASSLTARARSGTNFGVSGETSLQLRGRISAMIAQMTDGDVAHLMIFENDRSNTVPFDDSYDNYLFIVNAIRTARPHSPIIVCTCRPQADVTLALTYGINADQLARLQALNTQVKAHAAANSSFIRVADIAPVYALLDGYGDPNLYEDGLHPNTKGTGEEVLQVQLPVMQGVIRPGSAIETGPNLYPINFAVGGGDFGTGCSGVVPLGTRLLRSNGSGSTTVVASLITEGGVPKVQLDFTLGGTGVGAWRLGVHNAFSDVTITNNAWLKFIASVEVEDKPCVQGIQTEFYRTATSGQPFSFGAKYSPTAAWKPRNAIGQSTPSTLALPGVGTTFSQLCRLVVAMDESIEGTLRVKWAAPWLGEVPNPATL